MHNTKDQRENDHSMSKIKSSAESENEPLSSCQKRQASQKRNQKNRRGRDKHGQGW